MSYELENAQFESARNKAVDDYFDARPQIERTRDKECYIEAGFRMAWQHIIQQQRTIVLKVDDTLISKEQLKKVLEKMPWLDA